MDLIVKFVHENLRLPFSDVKSLQHNTGKSLVFIECQNEEQAIGIAEKNDGSHVIVVDNIRYKINVYMEDGATTVRVHDVSPQTENSSIEKELQKYGDVVWLKEETWVEPAVLKGIPNGMRSVRIRLHTAIPSYVNVNGEVTLVSYKHQLQTCRHCSRPVHWGRKCIEASYMEMQINGGNVSDRLRASGVDYAGALKASGMIGGRPVPDRNKLAGNKDVGDSSIALNYTNLGQSSGQPADQGQGKGEISSNTNSSDTTNTNNETNTNVVTGSSKPVHNKSVKDGNSSTELDKGSTSGLNTFLSNTYEGLISDDEMNGTNTEKFQSPSRKKRSLSKKRTK